MFCCDKHVFITTKVSLSRQNMFVATKVVLQHSFVATKITLVAAPASDRSLMLCFDLQEMPAALSVFCGNCTSPIFDRPRKAGEV